MKQFKTLLLNGGVIILTALAVVFFMAKAQRLRRGGEEAKVWFYDQASSRLYPAPQDLVSPDGKDDVRVRAVVIGFHGMGNEPHQLKIAYLEKYSPEFKTLLERAEAAHQARRPFTEKIPPPGSAYYLTNNFVKRPGESVWHERGAEEARQIMAEWRDWRGPGGQNPVVSVPSE